MKKTMSSPVDTGKPNAWVVSSKDRGRKSIKSGNKVYLNDGDSFEIELFNPLKESVLADIKVNGTSVSSTGLVIRPGQRYFLDCFVDDKKKFVYRTYEVENTSESKTAIEDNGFVEVYFYKEDVPNFKNLGKNYRDYYIDRYIYVDRWNTYPYVYPYVYPTYPNIVFGSSTTGNIFGSTTTNVSTAYNVTNSTFTDNNFNVSTSNTMGGSGDYNMKSCNTSTFDAKSVLRGMSKKNESIETGRIEKGEESKQEFIEVDMNFEKYVLNQVVYQLLPNSQKPIETDEIKNDVNFCGECGEKRGSTKFCTNCGHKLA